MKVDSTVRKIDYGQAVSILANIGIIAGILFLGFEIRQNTLISRSVAVQSITEQVNDWQIEMASNDNWMRITVFLSDGGSYAELPAEDRMRYRYAVMPTVRVMENRYRQVQLGIIDPAELDVGGGKANNSWYRSSHFIEFWRADDMNNRWSPDFVEFMETQVMAIL